MNLEVVRWIISGCLVFAILGVIDAFVRNRRYARQIYRRAYRRGIVHGYKKRTEIEIRRRQVELHNAGRRLMPREDSGDPAHVSKIKFQSGP